MNLEQEMLSKSFYEVASEADAEWERLLSRIIVKRGTERQRMPSASSPAFLRKRPNVPPQFEEVTKPVWGERAEMLKKRDVAQLSIINSQLSIKFRMYPDRDEPGERLFLQLRELLPSLEHLQLPPGCKDYSDYYLQQKTG